MSVPHSNLTCILRNVHPLPLLVKFVHYDTVSLTLFLTYVSLLIVFHTFTGNSTNNNTGNTEIHKVKMSKEERKRGHRNLRKGPLPHFTKEALERHCEDDHSTTGSAMQAKQCVLLDEVVGLFGRSSTRLVNWGTRWEREREGIGHRHVVGLDHWHEGLSSNISINTVRFTLNKIVSRDFVQH